MVAKWDLKYGPVNGSNHCWTKPPLQEWWFTVCSRWSQEDHGFKVILSFKRVQALGQRDPVSKPDELYIQVNGNNNTWDSCGLWFLPCVQNHLSSHYRFCITFWIKLPTPNKLIENKNRPQPHFSGSFYTSVHFYISSFLSLFFGIEFIFPYSDSFPAQSQIDIISFTLLSRKPF